MSSGSTQFDTLRDALQRDANLRAEVERAMHVNISRVNPSGRGNRFVTGAAVEWILAAAAWHCSILTVPAGHSANGFDLMDLRQEARGLWGIKSLSSAAKNAYRMSNGQGGGGRGFADPTIFVSPKLPGLVYASPTLHPELKELEVAKPGEISLPFAAIEQHAISHPECVAPLNAPLNERRGTEDPFLAYVQTILTPEHFPLLSDIFVAARPLPYTVSGEVERLASQRDSGAITQAMFEMLVETLARH